MSAIRLALPSAPRLAALALAGSLAALAAAVPAPTRAADFPPGYVGYHTYAELTAEIAAVEAAHPDIVDVFSIGQSYQGRQLWAAKVSDNVAVDEPEPEVLIDGLHHGNEHLSAEMTLAVLHYLVDGYGTNATITRLVDTREIWIVFMVNPDGGQYDLAGTAGFRDWRKNRQPNAGTTAIGTDLNRNYGYHWGCCGGSSGNPRSRLYRGPHAFSAPETVALRDFVNSRVVGGRQQIRAAITFHTAGRLVLWPYGYTRKNVPADMTREDAQTAAAIGRAMAARNGYKAEQSSDLYVTDGDEIDWLYGVHRIFAFTIELGRQTASGDDPPDSAIGPETRRNLGAVVHLIDRAGCVYAAIGREVADCGAFFDDFEIARGWVVNPDGTDTAIRGRWQRGNPAATALHGPKQLGSTTSGSRDLATGLAAGSGPYANDLDGGVTTVESPPITLPADAGQHLTFRWSFAHAANATAADYLRVTIVGESASRVVLDVRGAPVDRDGAWRSASTLLDDFAGQTVRIRIAAADAARASLVEAAIDDVRVTRPAP